MKKDLITRKLVLNATDKEVWNALTTSSETKKYMFNCEVFSDWQVGSEIIWKGNFKGYESGERGHILEIEENKRLKYSSIDPNFGIEITPENYLHISYDLDYQDGKTILTTTIENFNGDPNRLVHVAGGWDNFVLPEIEALFNHTNNQIIQKFHIIGIATKTINTNGQSAIDIEALWQKFWNDDIQNQIPNKINDDIYAVYTNYESDFTGFYATIIGLLVSTLDEIPENMTGLTIETTTYHKIVSKGKMPEAIGNTWLEIWADKALDAKRAYKADFTIHGEKYDGTENAEIETYLSIK